MIDSTDFATLFEQPNSAFNHELLTAEEEQDLARRIQAGDDEAFETLVRHNLRLVWAFAKRVAVTPAFSHEDAFQAGVFGLMVAARRFEPERGCRFSTIAVWWIRQAIRRALDNEATVIRLPSHMAETLRALRRRVAAQYAVGAPPPVEAAVALAEASQQVESLSKIVGENLELGELIPDQHDFTLEVDDDCERAFRRSVIDGALTRLSPREREVIELRFGLRDGTEYTLQEVGDYFGVSRERIRQIEQHALARLRDLLHGKFTELAA